MQDFLTAVIPVDIAPFIEIRAIQVGRVVQRYFNPREVEDLLAMQSHIAQADEGGWDVYYGVLPRLRRGGTADDVSAAPTVLWADIDAKAMPVPPGGPHLETQKREAWYRLTEFTPEPSIIVDSGNGYHAYWLLSATVDWRFAEASMRAIAEVLQSDHVYDRPRILRVPGTHNHKNDPPTPVRLMRFNRDRLYRPGAFVDLRDRGIEIMEPPRAASSAAFDGEAIANVQRDGKLPDWLTEKIANRGDDRSEHSFSTALWLLRYGMSPDDVVGVFTDSPDGVGNKFWEKGGPGSSYAMSWLLRTIRKADDIA
jgi:hypothetical protein